MSATFLLLISSRDFQSDYGAKSSTSRRGSGLQFRKQVHDPLEVRPLDWDKLVFLVLWASWFMGIWSSLASPGVVTKQKREALVLLEFLYQLLVGTNDLTILYLCERQVDRVVEANAFCI